MRGGGPVSDPNGAERSDGNDSYINWLSETWNTVHASEPNAPEEPAPFISHPAMGSYVPWQARSSSDYIKIWLRGLKCVFGLLGGISALAIVWQGLVIFVNATQAGFGR